MVKLIETVDNISKTYEFETREAFIASMRDFLGDAGKSEKELARDEINGFIRDAIRARFENGGKNDPGAVMRRPTGAKD